MQDNIENQTPMSFNETMEIFRRMSGSDENGIPNSIFSYMFYDPAQPGGPENASIRSFGGCPTHVFVDKANPEFVIFDIEFGPQDKEWFNTVWRDLLDFKQQEQNNPDNTWVFFINLTETDGIEYKETGDSIASLNALNPVLFTGIRENPLDTSGIFNTTLRLVFFLPAVSYEVSEGFDSSSILDEEIAALGAESFNY